MSEISTKEKIGIMFLGFLIILLILLIITPFYEIYHDKRLLSINILALLTLIILLAILKEEGT
jgi:glucan phosphoethanolaminetransferase (alkaline phosphatase superfamily)